MRTKIAWVLCALLFGCPEEKKAHVEPIAQPGPPPPRAPPKDLLVLDPVIVPVPEASTAPEKIVVHFLYPIVDGPNAAIDQRTRLVIRPSDRSDGPGLQGTLRFSSSSTLEFLPTAPFDAATEYRVRLESVQFGEHEVKGPVEKTFRTPAFGFLRADLASVEPAKNRVAIDLVFTAPVLADDVGKHASLTIADRGAPVRFERTAKNNVVRATISELAIGRGTAILLVLNEGVRSLDRASRAGAFETRIQIPSGEPIKIYASHVREGASGYYLQIVCHDSAIAKPAMYYWDDIAQSGQEMSRRCVLDDEDAKASIHFEPKVDFTLSPMRGGFRILGKFQRGSYSVRIDQSARSIDGGVLLSSFIDSFSVPARNPQIGFVSQGRYLPRSAWRRLAMRHLNMARATLRLRNIPAHNLVFWLSGEDERADSRNSTLILEHEIELAGAPDALTTTWIDVSRLMQRTPTGVLELELSGPGVAQPARARLLLTDINLIAKREHDGRVRVFAVGIHDNQPLAGVQITQVVPSGREVSKCVTAWDGACELAPLSAKTLDRTEPFAILASLGEDLTYLSYDELETPISEDAVQGRPYDLDSPYRAAIWSDRGVYRPGDTARFAAIIRDENALAPDPQLPIVFELFDPRRKAMKRIVEETNEAGMVAFDVSFADFATTGRYRLVAEAGKKPLGEIAFNVEEFVPERMKVNAHVAPEEMFVEDDARVQIEAAYLFGGSAKHSPFEVSCELRPARFEPKRNASWEYGVWRQGARGRTVAPLPLGKSTGVLGEGGIGDVQCPELTGRGRFAGTARVFADVSVFEAGSGRTSRANASGLVHPEHFYIGLKSSIERVKAGDQVPIEGITVDWIGERIKEVSKVSLALFKIERERDWVYDEVEGFWNHREYERLVLEAEHEVSVKDGSFAHAFTVAEDGGGFVVRATSGRARTDLVLDGSGSFYWTGNWGEGEDRTPRPARPASIEINAPEVADVGTKIPIHFVSPFAGRALVTVETDRVLEREWLDVLEGDVEWSFEVDRFVPNAYVSVLAMKDPHSDSPAAFIPERGFGVRSIQIEPAEYRRRLSIRVPEVVRSNERLAVKLDLGELDEPTFVTVAVVDEGILSLTKFKSPDPFDAIFEPRGLGVETFETIGWNLLLPAGGVSRTTGGDALSGLDRVQQVKPVALWSGLVEVPANGKLEIPFDVPQYRGLLRVMVVGAGTKRMASGEAKVLVRDPLVLQTTLPRFLIDGDRTQVPVFVTNVSGADQSVTVDVSAKTIEGKDDAIEIVGDHTKTKKIADGANATFLFEVLAKAPTGAAKLEVSVEGGGHVAKESLDLPLSPNAPKSRVVKKLELPAGRTEVTQELIGWLPTTEKSTFWVTPNPYGPAFQHLTHLLRYPYGCLEQTVSSTRPLLFLGKLLPNVDPRATLGKSADELVMHGLSRVLAMQTPEGGFAYWPGSNEATTWGGAYAIHLLLDARTAGYPIPEARVEDALGWLERKLDERDVKGFDEIHSRPYLHFVAAIAGRGRKAEMLQALEQLEAEKKTERSEEELYMLKAGLHAMGDRSFEADLKQLDLEPIREARAHGFTFWSDRRARGFMLSTFVDLFGRDPAGERMATLVADSLTGHRSSWYTTQELVWGINGLGKWVGDIATDFEPPVLWVGNKEIQPTASAGNERTWSIPRASERGKIAIDVKASDRPLFLVLSSEGVQRNAAWSLGGDGLAIDRDYRRSNGEPINLGDGSLALGDVIYAVVTIENQSGGVLQNIALVDRFPSGWEIENPRLGRSTTIDWIQKDSLWEMDHLELRDDRIEVFGSLKPKEPKKVVYALRAVSAGKFNVPPVEAEAMYDPSFWARAGGGTVTIKGPW